MTILIITLLALWLLVSAMYQLNLPPARGLRAHDVLSLIPNWSFFAPRPGTFDYHLLFRDCNPDGTLTRWKEVPLADERTIRGALWNPEKRNRKALSDSVRGLVQLWRQAGASGIYISLPYLATLNYISSIPRSSRASATQFMILQTDGFISSEEPQLVFISNVHRL